MSSVWEVRILSEANLAPALKDPHKKASAVSLTALLATREDSTHTQEPLHSRV